MDISFLVKGIAIGFSASIPLGPIGVLCIQRTINKKFLSGFFSGLGAATADTIFAIVAMFFLSLVLAFIDQHLQILTVAGGVVVAVIGYTIFSKKITPGSLRKNRAGNNQYFKDYFSTLLLTLTNPAFIFVFIAMFTTFGVNSNELDLANGIITIIGVTCGAAIWWFTLTSIVSLFKKRFRPRHLVAINKIAGIIIMVLGAAAVIGAIVDLKAVAKLV